MRWNKSISKAKLFLVFILVGILFLMPYTVAIGKTKVLCTTSIGTTPEAIHTKNYSEVDLMEEETSSYTDLLLGDQNLLSNPSFEDGFDGPLGWKHRAVCGSTFYTWDSKYSYNGTHSVGILNVSSICNPDNYWYTNDYIDVDFTNFSYQTSIYHIL